MKMIFLIVGPPQLSVFARSDSDSVSDELSTVVKQVDENVSKEIVQKSDVSSEKKDDNEGEENNDGANFIGFLQLLQSMSGGAIRVTSTNDDNDEIQGLLTRLGIVTRKFHLIFLYSLIRCYFVK